MVSVGPILQARNRRLSYIFLFIPHIYPLTALTSLYHLLVTFINSEPNTEHSSLILKENARDGSSAKGSIAPDGKGKWVPSLAEGDPEEDKADTSCDAWVGPGQ